uniref:Uncharacterized protein n=1 Tax=Panagrolaimus sp. PS1159 TaxID=55785 RepID=A0AC35FG93_9BILA
MKPRKWKIFRFIRQKFGKSNVEENVKKMDETVMQNIGSLYLRLGAVVFAIIAVVYFSYSAYLRTFLEFDVCSVIFTILQTHFVFCSSTVS